MLNVGTSKSIPLCLEGLHDPGEASEVPGQGEHRGELLRDRNEAEGASAEPLRSAWCQRYKTCCLRRR